MRPRSSSLAAAILALLAAPIGGQEVAPPRGESSYLPVDLKEPFAKAMERMKRQRAKVAAAHADLLSARYDLATRPAKGVTMSRGKPVQEGVRARLPTGATWD